MAFYLNFYVVSNLLGTKVKEFYVLCGIFGFVAILALDGTALAPVRKWSYRVFYATHVVSAIALLPILFFHVSHIRIYLYETAAVYLLGSFLRWRSAISVRGTVRALPGSCLVEIMVPINSNGNAKRISDALRPGQHVYVSLAGNPWSRTYRSNPFTVASVPDVDRNVKFVVRALDGNTAKLKSDIGGTPSDARVKLVVEGAYGTGTHEDKLLQYDRVLFIAGGVGATFTVPLYRQLLADLSPSKGSYRRHKVSFVWIAKSKAEVTWAIPKDHREKDGFTERLKICLTGLDTTNADGSNDTMDYDENRGAALAENEDGIELEEQKELLSNIATTDSGAPTGQSDLPIYTGRPDLRRLVDQTFSHGSDEKIAIIVCGPQGMDHKLRQEITPWVNKGRDVWFHDESFSI